MYPPSTFDDSDAPRRPLPPLRRLLELLRPDRGELWAVAVFAVATGSLLLATPIAVQALVNFVAFGGAKTPILVLTILLACGLGLAAVLSAVQTWIVEILQRRVFVRTVSDLVLRIPRIHPDEHRRRYGPELVNRFFDVVTVQKMTSYLLLDGLGVILGVLIGMLVLAFYHPILLAFDLTIVLAVVAIVFGLGRAGVRTAIGESKAKYRVAAWLEEVARNPQTFKNPDGRRYVQRRADDLTRNYVLSRRVHYRVLFRQILGAFGLQVAASVALLGIGGLLVVRGELTLGQLVAAELIVTHVVGSVAKMGKHFEAFYDLMGATDKLGLLLDVQQESTGRDQWTAPPPAAGSELKLEGVTVRPVAGTVAATPLSLTFESGDRVALTAEHDATTTLLLERIEGLRTDGGGTVEVDALDVRTAELSALRRRVSRVARPETFEGSLRDNLTLGRDVGVETLREVIDRVGLTGELRELPHGIDTGLNGHGQPLSAGQLARLALARAMLQRPSLLLVDGLLDVLTERELDAIVPALCSAEAPWTLVVASRRREVWRRFPRVVDLSTSRSVPHEAAS